MARITDNGCESGSSFGFVTLAGGITVDPNGAITGQYGLRGFSSNTISAVIGHSALSEIYIGLNHRGTTYNHASGIFNWRKAGTVLASVRMTATRQISAWVGGSKVATGTKVWQDNQVYNIQARYKIHDTTGSLQVRVDGNLDIDYDNQDTKPGSETDFDEFLIGNAGTATGGSNFDVDDIFLNDTTGGINNSWPGIRYIYPALPTGDSASNNAWSKSTGSAGWSLVDERPHNTTDYVFSSTNGQQQGFTHAVSGVPAASVVKAVRFDYVAYKISSGQIKVGCRSGSTESLSAALDLGISPEMQRAYFEQDPATTADWASIAAADAAESLVEAVV